ncbi:MAG: hypothetical protein QNJ81_02085 [Acidimicrobiia bacterium]|nr:hypothetical protein [Acidimicrobiia bacterium]
MSEENGNNTEATPAPSGPAAGIARGRMHAALVYAIKFQSGEAKDGEVARKFATTPGKVNDIRKDRNFKYVTEELSFTADEVQEAVDRFTASVNAENSTVAEDDREELIENATAALGGVPTHEGDSQLAGVRKADRKPRGKTAEEAEESDEGAGDESDLDAMLEG